MISEIWMCHVAQARIMLSNQPHTGVFVAEPFKVLLSQIKLDSQGLAMRSSCGLFFKWGVQYLMVPLKKVIRF